jgi:hypothetical protein
MSDDEALLGQSASCGIGRGRELVCESEDDDLLDDHQVGQVSANCSS